MDDQLGVSGVSSLLNAFTSLTVWWFRPSICSVHSDFFDISSTRSHGCKLFDHEVFGQSFLKHFLVAASCSTSQSRHGTTDSSEWHRQGETASVKNCHNERCAPSCVPYMTLSRTACPILILIVFAWHLDHDDATCARLISQNPKTVTSASIRRSSVMHQLIMSLRLTGDGVAANALLASSGVNSQTRSVSWQPMCCVALSTPLCSVGPASTASIAPVSDFLTGSSQPSNNKRSKTVLWRFALFDATG